MLRFRQELADMPEAEFANHIKAVEAMKLEKDKVGTWVGGSGRVYVCMCECVSCQGMYSVSCDLGPFSFPFLSFPHHKNTPQK